MQQNAECLFKCKTTINLKQKNNAEYASTTTENIEIVNSCIIINILICKISYVYYYFNKNNV